MTRAVLVGLLTCLAASLPPVGAPVPAARVSTLFQLGVEVVDIASHFGITARRVNQIVRAAGLRPTDPPKPSPRVHFMDRAEADALALMHDRCGHVRSHSRCTPLLTGR